MADHHNYKADVSAYIIPPVTVSTAPFNDTKLDVAPAPTTDTPAAPAAAPSSLPHIDPTIPLVAGAAGAAYGAHDARQAQKAIAPTQLYNANKQIADTAAQKAAQAARAVPPEPVRGIATVSPPPEFPSGATPPGEDFKPMTEAKRQEIAQRSAATKQWASKHVPPPVAGDIEPIARTLTGDPYSKEGTASRGRELGHNEKTALISKEKNVAEKLFSPTTHAQFMRQHTIDPVRAFYVPPAVAWESQEAQIQAARNEAARAAQQKRLDAQYQRDLKEHAKASAAHTKAANVAQHEANRLARTPKPPPVLSNQIVEGIAASPVGQKLGALYAYIPGSKTVLPALGNAVSGVASSLPARVGLGALGAYGIADEGMRAYNHYNQGNYGRAAVSGLGALSNAALMSRNPYLMAAGALGLAGSSALEGYLDRRGRPHQVSELDYFHTPIA